ncbi:MAG TPA: PIN domain-containing protein [Acidimicrobiales bacterium]|nr:PIN domain-containing protein [Acidimicrobiales bacterium]
MTFAAVLDTCVLYPAHLRDTLLRLTERGFYRALWSADIVEELRRNLTEVVDPSVVDRLLGQMTAAFPDAEVTGYQALIDGLTCDPKDRHVLASAVRANAGAIVTFNTTDFPDHSIEPYAVEVIHPDTFLLDLLDLAPGAVVDELSRQAAANRRAPRTLPQILDALERGGVPAFADEVRRRATRPG